MTASGGGVRLRYRAALFAALLVAAIAWVSARDGDGAHVARRFFSELFRRLF